MAAGAEGIVAKDRTAPYVSGRTRAFVKIKGYPRTDVVIVGYMPSTKNEHFASLHAAVEEDGKLRYVGGIGTGYTEAQRARIFAQDLARRPAKPPPALDRRMAERPQVRQNAVARGNPLRRLDRNDGHLRQARFLAMREDLPVKTPSLRPSRRRKPRRCGR